MYIVSYRMEGMKASNMTQVFPSTGEDPQRITLSGLDPGSTYSYSIQAATAAGVGKASFERSFTTAGQGAYMPLELHHTLATCPLPQSLGSLSPLNLPDSDPSTSSPLSVQPSLW